MPNDSEFPITLTMTTSLRVDGMVDVVIRQPSAVSDDMDIVIVFHDNLDEVIDHLQKAQAANKAALDEHNAKRKAVKGAHYRHKKGGEYVVDSFSTDTDDEVTRVEYHAVNTPNVRWSRRLAEFEDGRFTRIDAYPDEL